MHQQLVVFLKILPVGIVIERFALFFSGCFVAFYNNQPRTELLLFINPTKNNRNQHKQFVFVFSIIKFETF